MPASPMFSGFKSLSVITSSVPATQIESKEKASIMSTTLEPKDPTRVPDVPKGIQHEGGPNIEISAKIGTSNIVTGISLPSSAAALDIGNFQFTMDTPIPQQPGHSSASELFLFTQEAKQPLKEAKFRPAKRPVFETYVFTETKDTAEAPMFQVVQKNIASPAMIIPTKDPALTSQDKEANEESKFLPVKPTLAEAFALTPEVRKRPIYDPYKTSLAEASTPTPEAQKPVEEPRLIPVKSPLATSSVPMRQARQSTEFRHTQQ